MFRSRVYIAEADKQLQRRLSDALKKKGFDVRVFDSGYPVVEMMDNWPDVFLIDIELPGINGLEICKWLKSHESSSNIPVILISGEPYFKILASSAHPDDYIEKPVSLRQVIDKIRELLPMENVG
jgi:DNA-binding response OmpR family regulator